MSDFLKKFSDHSYQDMKKINYSEEEQEEIRTEDIESKIEVIHTQEVLTNETQGELQVADTSNTTFQTSNTREEVYVQDDEKIKKRKQNIMIGIIGAILIIVIGFFGYRKFNEIRVPQFVPEKTLNDVQVWAAKNKIDMEYTSAFSATVDDGYVIKQSMKSGTTIQKGSNLKIILSKGANPEEHIKVPDLMKMSLTEIEDWRQKQKVVNVTIEKVFSDDVETSRTIRFEYKTEGIDASNYRRKDKLNIVVSKGKEAYEKNIDMPDFKDKSKAEVEAWAKENEIVVEFMEAASSKVMEGNVISQDVPAKTKIAKKDVMKVTISRGKISYVPNFGGLDETQGQMEATKANVVINTVYYYSNSVRANHLISQSIPAGTEIKEQTIALMYSLGKPYIGNFDGEDVFTMVQSLNEMNTKGAQLTYELVDVSSTEKKGSIVTSNYKASFVNVGTHIVISVASGN